MKRSRWFKRGWTLQELVAHPKVVFYDRDWLFVGSRHTMAGFLEQATGTPKDVLFGDKTPFQHTVAARMSWASKRSCTRVEDTAYCLMGLFGVHMPLIYGEGKKAFIRLQEAMLQESDDQTLLAWTVDQKSSQAWARMGVLAESPANFALSGGLKTAPDNSWEPWSMGPLGLKVLGFLRAYNFPHRSNTLLSMPELFSGFQIFETLPGCGRGINSRSPKFVTVRIMRKADSGRVYHRLVTPGLEYHGPSVGFAPENEPPQPLYIAKKLSGVQKAPFEAGGSHLFHLPMAKPGVIKLVFPIQVSKSATPFAAIDLTGSRGLWERSCVQLFEDRPLEESDPFCMNFENQVDPQGPKFKLYFGVGSSYAYVGLFLFEDDRRIIQRIRDEPGAYCNNRSRIRHQRGVLVQCSLEIERTTVTAKLVSGDAETLQNEMVGARVHFFVQMEFETRPSSEEDMMG